MGSHQNEEWAAALPEGFYPLPSQIIMRASHYPVGCGVSIAETLAHEVPIVGIVLRVGIDFSLTNNNNNTHNNSRDNCYLVQLTGEEELGKPLVFLEHELCFAPSTSVWLKRSHQKELLQAIILGLDMFAVEEGDHYMVLVTEDTEDGSPNDSSHPKVCSSVPLKDLFFRPRDNEYPPIMMNSSNESGLKVNHTSSTASCCSDESHPFRPTNDTHWDCDDPTIGSSVLNATTRSETNWDEDPTVRPSVPHWSQSDHEEGSHLHPLVATDSGKSLPRYLRSEIDTQIQYINSAQTDQGRFSLDESSLVQPSIDLRNSTIEATQTDQGHFSLGEASVLQYDNEDARYRTIDATQTDQGHFSMDEDDLNNLTRASKRHVQQPNVTTGQSFLYRYDPSQGDGDCSLESDAIDDEVYDDILDRLVQNGILSLGSSVNDDESSCDPSLSSSVALSVHSNILGSHDDILKRLKHNGLLSPSSTMDETDSLHYDWSSSRLGILPSSTSSLGIDVGAQETDPLHKIGSYDDALDQLKQRGLLSPSSTMDDSLHAKWSSGKLGVVPSTSGSDLDLDALETIPHKLSDEEGILPKGSLRNTKSTDTKSTAPLDSGYDGCDTRTTTLFGETIGSQEERWYKDQAAAIMAEAESRGSSSTLDISDESRSYGEAFFPPANTAASPLDEPTLETDIERLGLDPILSPRAKVHPDTFSTPAANLRKQWKDLFSGIRGKGGNSKVGFKWGSLKEQWEAAGALGSAWEIFEGYRDGTHNPSTLLQKIDEECVPTSSSYSKRDASSFMDLIKHRWSDGEDDSVLDDISMAFRSVDKRVMDNQCPDKSLFDEDKSYLMVGSDLDDGSLGTFTNLIDRVESMRSRLESDRHKERFSRGLNKLRIIVAETGDGLYEV